MLVVFFFKQKTAYDMRISDWSSDVCSSDLLRSADQCKAVLMGNGEYDPAIRLLQDISMVAVIEPRHDDMATLYQPDARSEEHTSELQSLMRISYAVSCLKKKHTATSPSPTRHTPDYSGYYSLTALYIHNM